jgi:hypothetical protein
MNIGSMSNNSVSPHSYGGRGSLTDVLIHMLSCFEVDGDDHTQSSALESPPGSRVYEVNELMLA